MASVLLSRFLRSHNDGHDLQHHHQQQQQQQEQQRRRRRGCRRRCSSLVTIILLMMVILSITTCCQCCVAASSSSMMKQQQASRDSTTQLENDSWSKEKEEESSQPPPHPNGNHSTRRRRQRELLEGPRNNQNSKEKESSSTAHRNQIRDGNRPKGKQTQPESEDSVGSADTTVVVSQQSPKYNNHTPPNNKFNNEFRAPHNGKHHQPPGEENDGEEGGGEDKEKDKTGSNYPSKWNNEFRAPHNGKQQQPGEEKEGEKKGGGDGGDRTGSNKNKNKHPSKFNNEFRAPAGHGNQQQQQQQPGAEKGTGGKYGKYGEYTPAGNGTQTQQPPGKEKGTGRDYGGVIGDITVIAPAGKGKQQQQQQSGDDSGEDGEDRTGSNNKNKKNPSNLNNEFRAPAGNGKQQQQPGEENGEDGEDTPAGNGKQQQQPEEEKGEEGEDGRDGEDTPAGNENQQQQPEEDNGEVGGDGEGGEYGGVIGDITGSGRIVPYNRTYVDIWGGFVSPRNDHHNPSRFNNEFRAPGEVDNNEGGGDDGEEGEKGGDRTYSETNYKYYEGGFISPRNQNPYESNEFRAPGNGGDGEGDGDGGGEDITGRLDGGDERTGRVPSNMKKLRDSNIERGSDIAALIEEQGTDSPTAPVKDDDDYTVEFLADDVPWDDDTATIDGEGEGGDSTADKDIAGEEYDYYYYPAFDGAMILDEAEILDEDYEGGSTGPVGAPTFSPTETLPEVLLILEDDVPWDDVVAVDVIAELASNLSDALELEEELEELEEAKNRDPSNYNWIRRRYPTTEPSPMPSLSHHPTTTSPPTHSAPPSEYPSDLPSMVPSGSPSYMPTGRPTQYCHDATYYQSPINNLTCAAHANTNCLSWRFLGLNMTQLEDLVNSCPETCNVECGSFALFVAPVSFRISRVNGFMDTFDVDELTDYALDYLEAFVREYIGSGSKGEGRANTEDTNTDSHSQSNSGSNDLVTIDTDTGTATEIESDTGTGALFDTTATINDVVGRGDGDDSFDYKYAQDDYLNDDVVVGDILLFEIETITLMSQNLVEDADFVEEDNNDSDPSSLLATGRLDIDTESNTTTDNDNDTDTDNANEKADNSTRLLLRRGKQTQPPSQAPSESGFMQGRSSQSLSDLQRVKQRGDNYKIGGSSSGGGGGGESILATDQTLDVILTFEGFIIGMKPETMSELIVLGIDSYNFARGLRRSSTGFFRYASVSSAMDAEEEDLPSDDIMEEDTQTGSLKFTTIITYLVPIAIFCFIVCSCVYHRYCKKSKQNWVSMYHHDNQEYIHNSMQNHNNNHMMTMMNDGTQVDNHGSNINSNIPLAANNGDDAESGRYFDDSTDGGGGINSGIVDEDDISTVMMRTSMKSSSVKAAHSNSTCNEELRYGRGNSTTTSASGSRLERLLASLNLNMKGSKTSTDPDTEESQHEEEPHDDIYSSGFIPDTGGSNNHDQQQGSNNDVDGKQPRPGLTTIDDDGLLLQDNTGLCKLFSVMSDGSEIDTTTINRSNSNRSKNSRSRPTIRVVLDGEDDKNNDVDEDDIDSSDDEYDSEFNMPYASVLPPMIIIDNIDIDTSNENIDLSNTKSPAVKKKITNSSMVVSEGAPLQPSSKEEQANALDKFASEIRDHLVRRSSQITTTSKSSTRGSNSRQSSGTDISTDINNNNGGEDTLNTSFEGSFYDAYSNASYKMTSQRGMFGPIKKKKSITTNKTTLNAQEFEADGLMMMNEYDYDDEDGNDHEPDMIRNLTSNASEGYEEEFLRVGEYDTHDSLDGVTPRRRRRSSSFSAGDDLDRGHHTPVSPSQYGTWDAPISPSASELAAVAGAPSSTNCVANRHLDRPLTPTHLHPMIAIMRRSQSDAHLSSLPRLRSKSRRPLPPKCPPILDRGGGYVEGGGHRKNNNSNSCNSSPIIDPNKKSSFSLLSPFSRSFAIPGIGMSSSVDSDGHKRKSSDTSDDLRVVGNSSTLSAITFPDESLIQQIKNNISHSNYGGSKSKSGGTEAVRLEFEGPRKGNWGLVLESSTKTGPMVYAVKDYSPLFGLIEKGDKLLQIDGKNVSQSGLSEVTKLLKGKASSSVMYRNTSTTVPIVVSRQKIVVPTQQQQQATPPRSSSPGFKHHRDGSYGSASSGGSSRIVEDVDDIDLYDHYPRHPQHNSNEI